MASATHEDAMLMMQIAQWGAQIELGPAMGRIMDRDFDPEAADARSDDAVRTVLVFGETVGTLAKHDLLDLALIKDWLWVAGLWSRVGPPARRLREEMGEPRLYENFEALARA